MIILAVMLALTLLYFNDLGFMKVLAFWCGYAALAAAPLIGVPVWAATAGGYFLAGAYWLAAKTSV